MAITVAIGLVAIWSAYYIHITQYNDNFIRGLRTTIRRQAQASAEIISASPNSIANINTLKAQGDSVNERVIQNENVLQEYTAYTGPVPELAVQYMRTDTFRTMQSALVQSIDNVSFSERFYVDEGLDQLFIPDHSYIIDKPRPIVIIDLARIIVDSAALINLDERERWIGLYIRGGSDVPYDSILGGNIVSGVFPDSATRYFAGAPVYDENRLITAALVFEYDISSNIALARRIARETAFIFVALSLLYIVITMLVFWILFKSLSRLLHNAYRLRRDDFNSKAYIRAKDEFGVIGSSTDTITEKLNSAIHEIDSIHRNQTNLFPSKYLEYLNKNSIDELEIGEYAERYVSILSLAISCPQVLERDFRSSLDLVELINDSVHYVGNIVNIHSGFIEAFSPSEILVLFPHNPDSALDTAKNIQFQSKSWNAERLRNGKPEISFTAALHCGSVAFTIVGEHKLIRPYATSNAIEITKKLSRVAYKIGSQIILTENFHQSIIKPLNYQFRYLGGMLLKTIRPLQVLEEIDVYPPDVKKLIVATKIDFEEAIKSFERNYLNRAQRIFDVLVESNPSDNVVVSFKDYLQKHHATTQ